MFFFIIGILTLFQANLAAQPPNSSIINTNWTATPVADLPAPNASDDTSKGAHVIPIPTNPTLRTQSGFQINVFADKLDNPRTLLLLADGSILLVESGASQIRLLKDTDGDGVVDTNTVFANRANGLNFPFGLAIAFGYLFVGNTDGIRRYAYQAGQTQLNGEGTQIYPLPGGGHATRNLLPSLSDQKLYVSPPCIDPLPRASVFKIAIDGSSNETIGWGLRNPVGLALHPVTGDIYTVVNERDQLGDNLVPDYLTHVKQGGFYGWPYVYLSPQFPDPRITAPWPSYVNQTVTPDVLFQSHSAPIWLAFYTGKKFPAHFQNGAFVCLHGSWDRTNGTGYKVVFVPFGANNYPVGGYEDFVDGFDVNPVGPDVWGRPAGLLVLPDGSLLFTDDAHGRIYRVDYVQCKSQGSYCSSANECCGNFICINGKCG